MLSNFLSRIKSISLVNKLAFFYSMSTMCILSALGWFLYAKISQIGGELTGENFAYFMSMCADGFIVTMLSGSIGAVILGYVVAKKGLSKIAEFEDKIAKISVDSLEQRLDLGQWPREFKNLGIQFNGMLEDLQNSFLKLSQFSSDIAHELRTPITNLLGVSEVALSTSKTAADYEKILAIQVAEYRHLAKLIDNLLFLARSDNGAIVINKDRFSAAAEINKLIDFFEAYALEKQITISCYGDSLISADIILFKRVINNLLSNAMRYTPNCGEIKVIIDGKKNITKIHVVDNGIGIARENLDKLFDRCYRTSSARDTESGGLGLGLAIAKSIIELHGGEIWVVSTKDYGSEFIFTIPNY